ncbi:MAG TPA: hypothetical protein VJ646_07240 [Candidatus Binatia bacterium]|nr:hypothetical protein [Candidatus Binatia bacterium]
MLLVRVLPLVIAAALSVVSTPEVKATPAAALKRRSQVLPYPPTAGRW